MAWVGLCYLQYKNQRKTHNTLGSWQNICLHTAFLPIPPLNRVLCPCSAWCAVFHRRFQRWHSVSSVVALDSYTSAITHRVASFLGGYQKEAEKSLHPVPFWTKAALIWYCAKHSRSPLIESVLQRNLWLQSGTLITFYNLLRAMFFYK